MKRAPQGTCTESGELNGIFQEIIGIFAVMDHVIASCSPTAEQLHEFAANLGDIRGLLTELTKYCAENDGTMNCRYLAERCFDLEGRVKELRNDLRRA